VFCFFAQKQKNNNSTIEKQLFLRLFFLKEPKPALKVRETFVVSDEK
jgi:hypothetical protein